MWCMLSFGIRKRPQCVLVCESAKVIWSPRKIVPNEEDNYTNPILEIYPKKISTIKNIKNKRFKTRSEFLLCRVLDFFCSTIPIRLKKKIRKLYIFLFPSFIWNLSQPLYIQISVYLSTNNVWLIAISQMSFEQNTFNFMDTLDSLHIIIFTYSQLILHEVIFSI